MELKVSIFVLKIKMCRISKRKAGSQPAQKKRGCGLSWDDRVQSSNYSDVGRNGGLPAITSLPSVGVYCMYVKRV